MKTYKCKSPRCGAILVPIMKDGAQHWIPEKGHCFGLIDQERVDMLLEHNFIEEMP